jgi:DNA ligase (NAD+)
VRPEQEFLLCAAPAQCRAALIGRLAHFADTADMTGFGEAILEQAFDAGILRSPEDFYALSWERLATLERCGEKVARKLVAEVEKKRRIELATFLRALGIPELGKHVSRILADRYSTIDAVLAATETELSQIHSIGETIARSVVTGLQHEGELIAALRRHVTFGDRTAPAIGETGPLQGKSFVFTGKLTRLDRAKATEEVERRGGTVVDSVSAALTYLVQGERAGATPSTKEKAARRLAEKGAAVKVISEGDFIALIGAEKGEAEPAPPAKTGQIGLFE